MADGFDTINSHIENRLDLQATFLNLLEEVFDMSQVPHLSPLEIRFQVSADSTLQLEVTIETYDDSGSPVRESTLFTTHESFELYMNERYKDHPVFQFLQDVGSTELACQLCLRTGYLCAGESIGFAPIADFFNACTTRVGSDDSLYRNTKFEIDTFFHALVVIEQDVYRWIEDDYGVRGGAARLAPEEITERRREDNYLSRVIRIIGRYQEIQLIREHEEELLDLVAKLYPDYCSDAETDIVATIMRYYRLGEWRNENSYLYTGNYNYEVSAMTQEERNQVQYLAQTGQAVVEWLLFQKAFESDQELQSVIETSEMSEIDYFETYIFRSSSWVASDGSPRIGYWADTLPIYLVARLESYEENQQILLKLAEDNSLSAIQRRYLLFTTQLFLSKRMDFAAATAIFNETYIRNGYPPFNANSRPGLVRRLLGTGESRDHFARNTRAINVDYVLQTPTLLSTLFSVLEGVLLDFHSEGEGHEINYLHLDFCQMSMHAATNTRKFIQRLITETPSVAIARGQLSENFIKSNLESERVRNAVTAIINMIKVDALNAVPTVNQIFPLGFSYKELLAIRQLVEQISYEYDAVQRTIAYTDGEDTIEYDYDEFLSQ